MARYYVEFYKINVMEKDAEPSGPCGLDVDADNFESATLKAVPELVKSAPEQEYNAIWNARIMGPENEEYEILREGKWLVDFKTGRRLEQRIH